MNLRLDRKCKQAEVVITLGPKGKEIGRVEDASSFVVIDFPVYSRHLTPHILVWVKRGNPVQLPHVGTADRKEGLWLCRLGRLEEANAVL